MPFNEGTLRGEVVVVHSAVAERRIGLCGDATRAPTQSPRWHGAAKAAPQSLRILADSAI